MNLRQFASLCLVLLLGTTVPTARAQYGELVRRLPNETNAILLLNVDQLHRSPLAVKEDWRADHEQQFAAGLVIVPPQASKLVMGAQMDLHEFAPKWQAALMELHYEPDLAKAAARLDGSLDNVGGREVAVLPGDLAVAKMGPKWAGMYHPADRQEVARWLNRMDEGTSGKLSPYMEASVKFAEGGAPLIMAIDLNHAVSAQQIRPILDELKSLAGQDVDKDALAEVLASIQGVSLGVTVREKRFGKIKVDFADDATIMAPFAKPLLLEILGRRGLMIQEFNDWKVAGSAHQITLEGDLYQSGMRRILSVLDAPPALQQQASASTQADSDSQKEQQKVMALATKRYFDAITTMMDDLRYKREDAGFVTWNQVGAWWEKYARKIDRLPTLNVDPEMLEFGAWVADAMRSAENALKGISPRSKMRMTEAANQYAVRSYSAPIGVTRRGVYGWGGWTATEDLSAKGQIQSQIRTQEKIRGNMSANNTAQGIEAAIGDMRRYMTQKYQMQF